MKLRLHLAFLFLHFLTLYITYARIFREKGGKMKYTINYENRVKELLGDKKYKYYIDTMGCALNENDSMKYSGIMSKMGMERTFDSKEANIILFNTCAIRENAEDKLYGRLGTLKKRKSENSDLYIFYTINQKHKLIYVYYHNKDLLFLNFLSYQFQLNSRQTFQLPNLHQFHRPAFHLDAK